MNPLNCCTPRFFQTGRDLPLFSLCRIKQVQENKCGGSTPQNSGTDQHRAPRSKQDLKAQPRGQPTPRVG